MVEVEVDQVVLAREPGRVHAAAVAAGLKRTNVEVAIAYDGRCVTGADGAADAWESPQAMIASGLLVARAGAGFPCAVHLERFASPARLCVTDEPRLAGVGGIGMLTLVVPTASLVQALARGTVLVRQPVSLQVLLTGRLRPFICARDVAFELLRCGVGDVVRRVEESCGAPVVLEYAGPSARSLSVGERSVLSAVAPQVGAAAALFIGDERTEVFLRDQRRSKAHRVLAPDAGAPCEEVVNIDLGAVDPLLLDERGRVRAVRDLVGQPVSQALLGGDAGATLRDLFAAAVLLKSKRVPSTLDFLVAMPSRQMLEVLSSAGALTDLLATGARLVEPDARVVSGELYGATGTGLAMRTCDPEPGTPGSRRPLVASAETLAYAIATGTVGDPRSFKRPVRVTVPRALPTDDVLVARKPARGDWSRTLRIGARDPALDYSWKSAQTLKLVDGASFAGSSQVGEDTSSRSAVAVVCTTLDEVRGLSAQVPDIARSVRAVLAAYIPSALVALFSAAGIAALRADVSALDGLKGGATIVLPHPSQWPEGAAANVTVGALSLPLTWLALGAERVWATGGPALARATPAPVHASASGRGDRVGESSTGGKGRRPSRFAEGE
jgi:aconitate hydratase